jgi:hypothetical protein
MILFSFYYTPEQIQETQRIYYPKKLYQITQKQNNPMYLL